MKHNNNMKISMNNTSSIRVTLPEILDVRYSEILRMFELATKQSRVLKVLIDFSENKKVMNSGWVILSDFTRHLEKRECEYKLVNYGSSVEQHFAR